MAQQINQPATGSISGITYSRNRYGPYSRARTKPVNPQSSKQQSQRQDFSALSLSWKSLNSLGQQNWETFAITHPSLNKLGEVIVLAPNAQYIKTNLTRKSAGLSVSNTVPSTTTFVSNTLALVATIDTTGPTRVLTLAGTNQATGYKAIVRASAPVSTGRVTPEGMRRIAAVAADAWGTPVNILSAWEAVWGVFSLNQRIILDVAMVTDTGYTAGFERVIANVVDVTP